MICGSRATASIVLGDSRKLGKVRQPLTGGRKCVKALRPKVAPVGAAGLVFRPEQLDRATGTGSILRTHFRVQCRAPRCFLHQDFRILRRCRKGP